MCSSNGKAVPEKRWEPRLMTESSVRIQLEGPVEAEIRAGLVDISSNGFRAIHTHAALTKGETVRFQHPSASGRARVIWNRITMGGVETGFLIV